MGAGNGIWAWQILRCREDYLAAWAGRTALLALVEEPLLQHLYRMGHAVPFADEARAGREGPGPASSIPPWSGTSALCVRPS